MQKFCLNNIKSFKQSEEIEMKPITVFVGKNSCGKSSLLRFPVMLAQTFREDTLTPLLLFGNLIDYGNYDDVSYRHGTMPLGFKISFGPELARRIRSRYYLRRHVYVEELFKNQEFVKNIELEVSIDKPEKKLQVRDIELYADGKKLCTIERDGTGYIFSVHQILYERRWEDREENLGKVKMNFYKFIPLIDEDELMEQYLDVDQSLNSKYMFDMMEYVENNVSTDKKNIARSLLQTVSIIALYFRGIQDYLRNEAEKTAYIGPFRENPKRTYRDSESNFNDVGVNGENTSMILRQAAQEDRKLLNNVSDWLYKTMGYSLSINDVGNGLYSLVVCGNKETDNIIDVGYGISQVLPIVTQLYNENDYRRSPYTANTTKRRTVIFEQPEIHLHPAAQAQLADLFVECINDKKGAVNRILIETHSEHLIRKLQVLVADPDVKISDDQVAIYYVDKDEKGDSYVEKMKLCENGQFEKTWPTGFFDKSYELTKMLMKANSKVSV
ncbi:DUF3696 domain-containing protein [Lachnospiraceae bacterium 48-21]|nr:DUF3696 domain-containing protein [Dorea sp.]